MPRNKSKFYDSLNSSRTQILEKIKEVFDPLAIEAHLLGSVARGNPDPYSDLDIWFTIEDSEWDNFRSNRIKYFSEIREVVHICEAPQNAPFNGIFSSVFIEINENILVADFYLCPKSSAFITNESKKLFGEIALPIQELSLNPQKISVPETYWIDFLICFIFGTIKKIVRNVENPLEAVLKQYGNLSSRIQIETKKIENSNNSFGTLKEIIDKTKEVATEKQKLTLSKIEDFVIKVEALEKN